MNVPTVQISEKGKRESKFLVGEVFLLFIYSFLPRGSSLISSSRDWYKPSQPHCIEHNMFRVM